MKRSTAIRVIAAALALSAAAVRAQTPNCNAGAAYSCFMIRAPYGLQQQIAQNHGLTLLGEISPGKPELVRATGPGNLLPETALANMQGDPDILNVELVTVDSLSETDSGSLIDASMASSTTSLTASGTHGGPENPYFAAQLWTGYTLQGAFTTVDVLDTHAIGDPEAMGTGVVAVIDTGVDPGHELLQGALVPGYDFLLDQPGIASEWSALATPVTTEQNLRTAADQSFSSIVEGNGVTNTFYPSHQPIVDQSFSSIVEDNNLPAAFGHGTMVAGIIRFTAPAAQIMPIRVFDANGLANTADVVEAVYWAVDNGANVINMSFSIAQGRHSKELQRALKYALRKGVVPVSSTGNAGSTKLSYPAAYGEVIGVASSDAAGGLSTFSNYGEDMTTVAAPGEEVVTLYPGDLYAAAWGTSFSSAFVAGGVALLHEIQGAGLDTASFSEAEEWMQRGADENAPGNNDPDGDGYGWMGAGVINDYLAYMCGPKGDALLCPQF